MFLLRSIFWLTIVFTSMSWTVDGMTAGPGAFGRAVTESGPAWAAAARQMALGQVKAEFTGSQDDPAHQLIAKAALTYLAGPGDAARPSPRPEKWCTGTQDACAQDAAKLTALIAADESAPAGHDALPPPPSRRALKAQGH